MATAPTTSDPTTSDGATQATDASDIARFADRQAATVPAVGCPGR